MGALSSVLCGRLTGRVGPRVPNASRQVGGVLGVALLGAFVSRHSSVVLGMHAAPVIAGGAFLVGCALTLLAVQRR